VADIDLPLRQKLSTFQLAASLQTYATSALALAFGRAASLYTIGLQTYKYHTGRKLRESIIHRSSKRKLEKYIALKMSRMTMMIAGVNIEFSSSESIYRIQELRFRKT
jgi:hypothetical protein